MGERTTSAVRGVDEAVDTLALGEAAGTAVPEPGMRIGRYRLLEHLGSGGMGSVFAAHDAELGRRIALKVLRTPSSSLSARAELLREAQALATVSHPNVVPIYDVGSEGELVWIAMAELRGPSLAQWLEDGAHDWREVVEIFLGAAAGLAAAHRDQLVHGDFKPANVIVEQPSGRAIVVDFGLARRIGSEPAVDGFVSYDALPRHDEATTDGVVHGTPAYMAPEQLRGQPLDARTDQYAFCVALFRALHRRHPFLDDDGVADRPMVRRLLARIDSGAIARTVDAVPRAIDRVLARGLSASPDRRWPGMDALASRLEAVLRPRAGWRVPLVLAALGSAAAIGWQAPSAARPCPEDTLEALWNDERAASVTAQLGGFDAPYAADTAERVRAGLDDYALRWRETLVASCAAADDAFDRRMRCLADRKVALATTIDVLEHADARTLVRAVSAVQSLADPTACADPQGELAPPELAALEDSLAEIDALDAAGRYDAALVAAKTAVAEADAHGEGRLQGEAYHRLGSSYDRLGRYGEAEPALDRAVWLALEAGDDDTAVGAMADLVKVVGHDLLRLDDARAWERHAEATLSRTTLRPALVAALRNSEGLLRLAAGEPDLAIARFADALDITDKDGGDPLRMASALNNYGNALAAAGRYAEARSALERAVVLLEGVLGPNHPAIAGDLSNLGFIADRQGQLADARAYLERGVAIAEQAGGDDQPGLHEATNNLAVFYYSIGELEEAERLFRRVRVLAERHLGAEHPAIAKVIGNLALCVKERGDPEGALVLYEQAIAMQERALGPDHLDLALTLNNRGSALRELGRFDEARASYRHALEIREARLDPHHPDIATTVDNLGLLARAEGRPADAVPLHERALAIWTRAHGEQHEKIGRALTHLGIALEATGEHTRALGVLERARAVYQSLPIKDPTAVADNELALAEAIRDDHERARGLARAALTAYEGAGAGYTDEVAATRALLSRIGG